MEQFILMFGLDKDKEKAGCTYSLQQDRGSSGYCRAQGLQPETWYACRCTGIFS